MKPIGAFLVCSFALWPALAEGGDPADNKIFSCPDASGEMVFQLGPCDAPQPNRKPVPKPEVPKPAATSKSKAKAKPIVASRPSGASVPAPPRAIPASAPMPARTKNQGIKPVINPAMFTADPKWGSPEKTLKTYIAAMKAGDRKLARACLVADALDDMGPRIDKLPDDGLRATVDGFTGFVMEGDLGPYWSIRALRAGSRPSWIFFERRSDGTWRIAAI